MSRGTYILVLFLLDVKNIKIGKLGLFMLPRGYYAYVGSAFGSGGLSGRLRHHQRVAKHPHWHVDYLRKVASLEAIWVQESDVRREHEWAEILGNMPGVTIPIARFGSSDCTCTAHLFYLGIMPPVLETFQTRVAAHFPNDAPMTTFPID
jgi:Uri superfamily endonuclease